MGAGPTGLCAEFLQEWICKLGFQHLFRNVQFGSCVYDRLRFRT